MSENSSNQPYYLKYRELGWLERQLPLAPDFFSEKLIDTICRRVGREKKIDQMTLAKELRVIAEAYWIAAMSSPLGIGDGPILQGPDERKRTIQSSVLHPAQKLIAALSDENLTLLSEWPDGAVSAPPDRKKLLRELELLVGRVADLIDAMEGRTRRGSPLSNEFKIDLAEVLTEVFRQYFPDVPARRGGYDRTKTASSEYTKFMEACGLEIFGPSFSFSGQVLDAATLPPGK